LIFFVFQFFVFLWSKHDQKMINFFFILFCGVLIKNDLLSVSSILVFFLCKHDKKMDTFVTSIFVTFGRFLSPSQIKFL